MDFPDIKQLKQLAQLCREAGIKTFKCPGFEFTLSEEAPAPVLKRGRKPVNASPNERPAGIPSSVPANPITEGAIDPMAMLFWSASGQAEDQERAEAAAASAQGST